MVFSGKINIKKDSQFLGILRKKIYRYFNEEYAKNKDIRYKLK